MDTRRVRLGDSWLERANGFAIIEARVVHFGCDRVCGHELGGKGSEDLHARRCGWEPLLLAAEWQDDRHTIVDGTHDFVGLGRENCEGERRSFVFTARVDTGHREGLTGFHDEAIG